MHRSVIVDCFPSSISRYRHGYAVIVVDVIRATTMAITAVASGRRTFCADSFEAALCLAEKLEEPILAGEMNGDVPPGFHMNNSPAELLQRGDLERPLVLLSSSGTKLMRGAALCEEPAYLASFRNYTAASQYVIDRHPKVAVVGAGSKQEFREEDQMCCAWIAEQLMRAGYLAEDRETSELVERWSGAPATACWSSNSVAYLRRSGQLHDFHFILEHIDDLDTAFLIAGEEVVTAGAMESTLRAA
jgi:2-phosphosulfolactate phosphatase